MEKLEFCCGGSEEAKSRPHAEETLVVRASGSVHQARSRPLLSAGPRSHPKKQRRPGRERIRPDNLGALLVVAAWRGEEKGKAGVVLASGGGFLRPGARNRWKGSGRRAPLASLPARLFV